MSYHRRQRLLTPALVVLLAVGFAGCAALGLGSRTDSTLIVDNNLEPGVVVTVFEKPAVGPRRRLGSVAAGTTGTLGFRAGPQPGRIQFIAEPNNGFTLATNPVELSRGATIRWNLRTNVATEVEPL